MVYNEFYGNGIDEVLMMERSDEEKEDGKRFWYHENALGSITHISNDKGEVVESYKYEAYGKVTIYDKKGKEKKKSKIKNRFMFTGREYDYEMGLYYYRARYYSPELGRFLQRDPIGYNINLYAYVNNNPIKYVDPFGAKAKQPRSGALTDKERLEVRIKQLEEKLEGITSSWGYQLLGIGFSEAVDIKFEIERLKENWEYFSNMGRVITQAYTEIVEDIEAAAKTAPEIVISILWEPADWALTIEDIRENGLNWTHGIGLIPAVPGTVRKVIPHDMSKFIPQSKVAQKIQRPFRELLEDIKKTPQKWQKIGEIPEQTTKGKISVREIWENIETQERVERHILTDKVGKPIERHPHYNPPKQR